MLSDEDLEIIRDEISYAIDEAKDYKICSNCGVLFKPKDGRYAICPVCGVEKKLI
jgi:rubrerythrin